MSPWRRCIEPGCQNPATRGPRCALCRSARMKAADAQRPNAVARGYLSKDWRKLREEVLERDQFCTWGSLDRDYAGSPPTWTACDAASTVAAHIVARSAGGSDELDNLRGLCKRHHDIETATHDGGFGRGTK